MSAAASLVVALYVQPGGEYYNRTQVDLWPEAPDAKRYRGPYPVVARPPCNRWCTLAALVQQQHPKNPAMRFGADGGTFRSALRAVRRWGGVLEHPAYSRAWPAHKLSAEARRWMDARRRSRVGLRGLAGGLRPPRSQAHVGCSTSVADRRRNSIGRAHQPA